MRTGTLKLIFASFFTLLLFQNCTNDGQEDVTDIIESQENKVLLDVLTQWGYGEADIEDKGGYYLVQGDLRFDKNKEYLSPDALEESTGKSPNPTGKQRRHPQSVAISEINVFINPGMTNNWINASEDALARWNAVTNTGLNLTEVNTAAAAHIEIIMDNQDPSVNLDSDVAGMAHFPSSYQPGDRTWVNPDADYPGECGRAMTQNDRIATVQHELGHNLGLTHTNDGTFGFLIPGTSVFDGNSVMNGGAGCVITDFSNNDLLAIRYLYPTQDMSPSTMTLNTQQPGGLFTITGNGPVIVSNNGSSQVFLHDGNGGPFLTTLNLTAPTTFSVYAPGIGSPGYNGGSATIFLSRTAGGVITSSTVNHSN